MKLFLGIVFLTILFPISGIAQDKCSKNIDPLYDRIKVLNQFARILKDTSKKYAVESLDVDVKGGKALRFFVYDLTDPSNNNVNEKCVNFINNHVYHFSSSAIPYSYSHIAVLENGNLKIFSAINCQNSKDSLENVINYLEKKFENDNKKEELLTRIKNYRKYAVFLRVEYTERVLCRTEEIPKNPDNLYDRWEILEKLGQILYNLSPDYERMYFPGNYVENSRGIGFFIYDLTDPTNKQTSLSEHINFINNHIYHFAFIDSPVSISNIVILEEGKLKFFKSLNCNDEAIKKVINYIKPKLKDEKNAGEILNRVRDYRKYGIYASFNGLAMSQCKE